MAAQKLLALWAFAVLVCSEVCRTSSEICLASQNKDTEPHQAKRSLQWVTMLQQVRDAIFMSCLISFGFLPYLDSFQNCRENKEFWQWLGACISHKINFMSSKCMIIDALEWNRCAKLSRRTGKSSPTIVGKDQTQNKISTCNVYSNGSTNVWDELVLPKSLFLNSQLCRYIASSVTPKNRQQSVMTVNKEHHRSNDSDKFHIGESQWVLSQLQRKRRNVLNEMRFIWRSG